MKDERGKSMEQTFAGMVAEIERLVKPLGFKIDDAQRTEKSKGIFKTVDPETGSPDEGLSITIVRGGKLG